MRIFGGERKKLKIFLKEGISLIEKIDTKKYSQQLSSIKKTTNAEEPKPKGISKSMGIRTNGKAPLCKRYNTAMS